MLDLGLLNSFVAVVEGGGFRLAARRLGVSQPLLSQHMRRLEQELGVPLIERSRRGGAPTPQGQRLLPHARRLVEGARQAAALFAPRPLVVGAASNPGLYVLPPLLRPEEGLRLTSNAEALELLAAGETDIAFTEWWDGRPGLDARPWRQEPIIGIAPPGHPLADGAPVPLARFLAEPLIGGEPGTGMGRVLAEALGDAAPSLRVTRAMGSTEGVKRAVAAGLGVSVLLACAARDELAAGSLVAVPLAGPALYRQLWAVLPADLPRRAPAHLFLERVRTGG
ncbi:LysR family transcriptional regulator [Falsiroseomonas selenitidurans]|uniref:LysR family transcriptional regulator n=1 Tax=Falsiroseomonas selenitidurans TaxID=2716335 RepID=A0ABX1E1S7_9PROT|nr:LysR family transcriptional regulator [Falsiroseomonas selenitidurans]NKC31084.1 LysR family transcriptional regulator [Falsiroseomonas selenitidurans]